MITRSYKDAPSMQTSMYESDFVQEGDPLKDLVDAPGQVALVVAQRLEVSQKRNHRLSRQQKSLFAFN